MNSQKGIIHIPLLLIAVIGVLSFLFISSNAPLRDGILSALYLKPFSFAANGTINVDPTKTYQTIEGWEVYSVGNGVTQLAGGGGNYSNYLNFRDDLFDKAIDMGITRFRISLVMPGPGQNGNCPLPVGSGFDFTCLDDYFDRGLLPYQQKLTAATGEKIWVNVVVVGSLGSYDANEYVRRAKASFDHLKQKYGIQPDSFEIALEPGVFGWGNAPGGVANVGKVAVMLGDALTAAGYSNIYFILPSAECGLITSLNYYNQIIALYPEVLTKGYMKEFAYHQYCQNNDADYATLVNLANQKGFKTAMLEHGGAGRQELHDDLTKGNVSSWEAYGLGAPAQNPPGQYADYVYFNVDNTGATPAVPRFNAKFLRQYFKYIRPGAVRIDATSQNSQLKPVAFINKDGKYVVVVQTPATANQNFTISGLPAGTYGLKLTTEFPTSRYDVDLADQTISAGQNITTNLDSLGVVTIYQKTVVNPLPSPSPGKDVTAQVVNLGNSWTSKSTFAKNVWDMQVFNGKIYLGHGDLGSNAGPIQIVSLNPATSSFANEFLAEDEEVSRFRVINGSLIAPGIDPREDWSFGNFYKLDQTGWKKIRTIPGALHNWDMYSFGSQLFTTPSRQISTPQIMSSSDNGASWQSSAFTGAIEFQQNAVFSIFFELNNTLYASAYDSLIRYAGSNNFSSLGLSAAKAMFPNTAEFSSGSQYTRVERPINFAGQLVYLGAQPDPSFNSWVSVGIYKAAAINQAQKIILPENNALAQDIIVGENGKLYVLANIKHSPTSYTVLVYETSDLNTFNELFRFSTETFARSFENINGSFYFGLGSNSDSVSTKTGDILKVSNLNSSIPPSPIKTGDLNNDARVNIVDFSILLSNWGNTACGNVGDLNKDCKVGILDFSILLSNWG